MITVNDKTLKTIAYAAGFDISDESAKEYLRIIVDSCRQDLINSGVKASTLVEENSLMVSTFIIYVTDNLNSAPGEYKISQTYMNNADKLRNYTFSLGDSND